MKSLFTFLALLFGITLQAQSLGNLKQETKKVYDATYTMDFNTILDYTYPKLFDIVDRTSMYETLDKTFQNEEFSIRFVHPNPKFTYSEIKTIGEQKFCIISYANAMRMTFEEKLDDETVTAMMNAFKETMKDKKITFEKERNSFLMEGTDILIAVSDNLTKKQWRFLNYDVEQLDFLDKILTQSIRKQIGLQ